MWNDEESARPRRRSEQHLVIDDEIIHAFIDDMLPPRQRLEVDEYLAANPEQARRVAEIQDQIRQFHILFDPSLNQRLPKRLQDMEDEICRKMGRQSRNRRLARGMANTAYASVLIIGGIAIGWFVPLPAIAPADMAALLTLSVKEPPAATPTEPLRPANAMLNDAPLPPSVNTEHVPRPAWASPPDLADHGFRLVSTRIIKAGTAMETAQLIYDTVKGDQVILYLARNVRDETKQVTMADEGAVSVLVWKDKGRSYTMVSEVGRDRMLALGRSISKAMALFPE